MTQGNDVFSKNNENMTNKETTAQNALLESIINVLAFLTNLEVNC